ncbi:MAG TPA: nucleotidyltransferase domain-containing protein [Polyangiaceae bacterium]|nr:nucleotidyltransferase domain-containing protein [Polyangiaceae bacterium]
MVFDWSRYTGNIAWLAQRTIYLARHGSHAYGTNIATSDEDFRGVAIAPREFYLGGLHRFDQAECKSPDLTIFDLRKFVGLAAQANPNVIEVLFVENADRLQVTAAGERLLSARELFVTRRIRHTFSGYAASQLKRIRAHRRWLMNPPAAPPERKAFGLPDTTAIPGDQLLAAEAAIRAQLDAWSADYLDELDPVIRETITGKMTRHLAEMGVAMNEDLWPGAARVIGLDDNFIEYLAREKKYNAAKKEWENYQTWRRERNPARAVLEAKFGIDTKHAMHLIRLLRMAREILETGRVIVRRPDAEELLSIRNGAWSYERIVDWAEQEDAALQEVAAKSTLPKAPDVEAIDRLCVELIGEAIGC